MAISLLYYLSALISPWSEVMELFPVMIEWSCQLSPRKRFPAFAEKGKAGTRHQTLGFSARNWDFGHS
jgi:hypothetical protein